MDIHLMVQSTPNPNALKFVLNTPVRIEGNVTYKKGNPCTNNPLAKAIFDLEPSIKEVYFFDNYITVTQDGTGDWDALEQKIRAAILEKAVDHDPNFKAEETAPAQERKPALSGNPDLDRINAILDQTVRPHLQMDGGDLQVVNYTNNVVKVFYQGACGSCPSSAMGTLKAVEGILKDEFNPDVTVELAENY